MLSRPVKTGSRRETRSDFTLQTFTSSAQQTYANLHTIAGSQSQHRIYSPVDQSKIKISTSSPSLIVFRL
ncbi:hypothetical protein NPIL_438671, partial [Nephila pilipes]